VSDKSTTSIDLGILIRNMDFYYRESLFTYDMFPERVGPLQENPLYKIVLTRAIENSGWRSKDPFDRARMDIYVGILFYLQVYYLYYIFSSGRPILLGEIISSLISVLPSCHFLTLTGSNPSHHVRKRHPILYRMEIICFRHASWMMMGLLF
jgi:hypothetical protein